MGWVGVLVLALGSACGDDESGTGGATDSEDSGVDDGTDTTADDGTTADDTASTSSADDTGGASSEESTGASTEDASTGTAGVCEPTGELLWPLELGRAWHYDLNCGACECDAMDWVVEVTAMVDIGGRDAFEVHEGCGLTDFGSYYAITGTLVEKWNEFTETWDPMWEEPVVDGQVWSSGYTQWTAVPEITVDAGSFTDCWRAEAIGNPKVMGTGPVYCPGIGVVQIDAFETDQSLASCES